MVEKALNAAKELEKIGIDAEVIDLQTIQPLDTETIFESVKKTNRLVVADPGWQSFGAGAEIIAKVCEITGKDMLSNPIRITLPDSHAPMSQTLEKQYHLDVSKIVKKIKENFKK